MEIALPPGERRHNYAIEVQTTSVQARQLKQKSSASTDMALVQVVCWLLTLASAASVLGFLDADEKGAPVVGMVCLYGRYTSLVRSEAD